MTKRKTLKAIAIAAAAVGCALAPAAFATSSNDVSVSVDTRYLETDWGVEKVYDVLSNKAESACDTSPSRDLRARKFERDCMSDLLDDFIKSADHEKLTAYHASLTN